MQGYAAVPVMYGFFYCSGGWVHDVSFSADGDKLAWVGHDSSISVVAAANQGQIYTIKGEFLPLMTCTWITSNSVVAAGKVYDSILA